MYTCDSCNKISCKKGDMHNLPSNCPCREEDKIKEITKLYKEPQNYKIAHNSALVEAEGYCQLTRVQEIILFAKKCGYKKIGLAFCVGLLKEAQIFANILRHHDFEVESIICKNGAIPKSEIDIKVKEQVRPQCKFEGMCNPIGQAKLLNDRKTDLNIILGLCVGHDSLFIKYSDAPITVLAAKDRVLGHNPLAAIYTSHSYYNKKLYD
ncbi:DUF1847 domain-containing protein [Fusobacterium hominis]|uniref:DUF1847 domain-containing protein n=1 Tax=Fusobacterium hominis TaxID=2764326 RepID=UPI0022E12F8D|nr:DUF1847 domain-containing protein [Fusobacterium hominis]